MKNKIIFSVAILIFAFSQITDAYSQSFTKLVVSLKGRVTDEVSNMPIDILMECFDESGKICDKKKVKASNKGEYFLAGLHPGKTYTVRFTDFKYFSQEFEIKIPNTDKYAEFSRDFTVKPKQKGAKIRLKVPPFELNKTKLRAGSNFFLKDNISLLMRNRRVNFEIQCYPDNDLDATKNQEMTNQRCESLRDFFVALGIGADRITIKGSASTDPDNPPPTEKRAKGKRYIGSTYIVIQSI